MPAPINKPEPLNVIRPWGSFLQYASNVPCTVSLMFVKPGMRLSLQSHSDRSELWIVIDTGAIVQVGETIRHCQAGQEIWIPAGEKHRLSCPAKKSSPIRVLEVAFGYWQQDDITRYQDDFNRLSN